MSSAKQSPILESVQGSPDLASTSLDREDIEVATSRSLVDAALGDIQELSLDIDDMSVYSVRKDHMTAWANKIRASLARIRNLIQLNPKVIPPKQSPKKSFLVDAKLPVSHTAPQPPPNWQPPPNHIIGPYVSGAVHLLMDSLVSTVNADWGTCFVYNAKSEELVLACSVGKRTDKPGTLRLSATSGIESHVLTTGIAVNVAHAYAEAEFRPTQDQTSSVRTRSELVFPLMKPGSNTHTFGVLQLCNKNEGTSFFDESDEVKVAECAQFVAAIIAKFPADITNPTCFDGTLINTSAAPKEALEKLGRVGHMLPPDATQAVNTRLVYRTARSGHLRRSEVLRDAGKLPTIPSIAEALNHVEKIHDSWRNAVLLNMELEQEITRLQDSLATSKREGQRLQTTSYELKKQLETATAALEGTKVRRMSSVGSFS